VLCLLFLVKNENAFFFLFFWWVQNPKMRTIGPAERESKERDAFLERATHLDTANSREIYLSISEYLWELPSVFSISNSRVTYIYLLLPPRAFLRRNKKNHAHVIRII